MYLSTVKSKKKNKQAEQKQNHRQNTSTVVRWEGVESMGSKGEGIKKYKLAGIEQSWGCKVQQREYSSQRTYMDMENRVAIA